MNYLTKRALWIFVAVLFCFPQWVFAETATAPSDVQKASMAPPVPIGARKAVTQTPDGNAKGKGDQVIATDRKASAPAKTDNVPLENDSNIKNSATDVDTESSASNDPFYKKTKIGTKPPLRIFGHDFFSGTKDSFAPLDAVPVSNDYIIGPGDEIKVVLWGRMDTSYDLEVNPDGQIIFPKVGPMTVAGLRFSELEEMIKLRLGAITGVNINVSLGKLRSIQVFVLGEVKKPGIYLVSALATIANALHSAGGLTPMGSLRKIELRRNNKRLLNCDLYDFLLRGDTTSDARLMSADVVFVPQAGPMVAISGNVKRPAIYELKDKKSIKTAMDFAGGLTPEAYSQRVQIMRPFEHRVRLVLDTAYNDTLQKDELKLQDGDWVSVSSILPAPVNGVYLYGNVTRPGRYEFKEGYRVTDIIPGLDSLALDSYLNYAAVKRYQFDDMEPELIPFDLGKLLLSKDEKQNIVLEPQDEIYVFNKWLFEDRPYATVSGEVREPGRYYIEEMRIKDLVFKAGDLSPDAYLPRAELIRIEKDRREHTIYVDLAEAMRGNPESNIRVQNEDRLIVHSIWETAWKEFATINGEIKKPGKYTDWRTKEVTIFTFNVKEALNENPQEMDESLKNNLLLQEGDHVVIHNIREYVPVEKITISGELQKPGTYKYAENMRIKDLIVVAKNVTRDAYMELGHLYRTDWRTKEVTIFTFNVKEALNRLAHQGSHHFHL